MEEGLLRKTGHEIFAPHVLPANFAVYAGVTHPAVPLYMSDRAYKAATGAEFAGRKLLREGGSCWKCGCADADTRHRYAGCPEVRELWGQVLGAWRRISGGERLDPGDEWVTAWGARWATWGSKEEQEAYEGEEMEEVFQVIHKATIQAVHEAAGRRSAGDARHMYNRVQGLTRRMIADRAASVASARFQKVWVEPGYVREGKGGGGAGREVDMWGTDFKRNKAGGKNGGGSGVGAAKEAEKRRAEGMVAGGAMEIYTDGSGQEAGAGWGWVAVVQGQERRARRGPVVTDKAQVGWRGAEKATNNTGELTAVLEALEWAEGAGVKALVIRYDSEYAACMTKGEWKAKANKELVGQCRAALGRAEGAGCKVGWKHVKGHSGDKWNDRADVLADEGVLSPPGGEDGGLSPPGGTDSGRVGGDEGGGREAGRPRVAGIRPTFKVGGGVAGARAAPGGGGGVGVRWTTYTQTSTRRVERATTAFGTLNLREPKQPVTAPSLRQRSRELAARVRREAARGEVCWVRAEGAVRKLKDAATRLASAATQRREIAAQRRPAVVRRVDCDINVRGLEEYVAGVPSGEGKEKEWRQVKAVLAKAKVVRQGLARLRIEYAYSPMGRGLVEAGHCTGSREYAIGVDPFKGWTKGLRGAAFHDIGWGCDDVAAFPMARMAMVPVGREVTRTFLEYREEIMAKVGDRLFGRQAGEEARRGWVKKIFAAYDNDASLEGWAKSTQGDHGGRRIRGMRLWVGAEAGGVGEGFEPEKYWEAQGKSSEWMWEHAGAELREYVSAARPRATDRAKMGCWKSYVLQEAEATGREAKVSWAVGEGVEVHSMQHDCVVLGRVGSDAADEGEREALEEVLGEEVSKAVGYRVEVKAEWCEEVSAIVWAD